jgi:hypothetical protein
LEASDLNLLRSLEASDWNLLRSLEASDSVAESPMFLVVG